MLVPEPLTQIFGGTRAQVLGVLLEIEAGLTVRRVATLANVAPTSASVALSDLARAGVLTARPLGRAIEYRVEPRHFAVEHLRGLLLAARRAEDHVLTRLTRHLGQEPKALLLFGSLARGEAAPDSDIDLLVIAPTAATETAWRAKLPEAADELSAWLGRTVNLQVSRAPTKADAKRAFWRSIRKDVRSIHGQIPSALAL